MCALLSDKLIRNENDLMSFLDTCDTKLVSQNSWHSFFYRIFNSGNLSIIGKCIKKCSEYLSDWMINSVMIWTDTLELLQNNLIDNFQLYVDNIDFYFERMFFGNKIDIIIFLFNHEIFGDLVKNLKSKHICLQGVNGNTFKTVFDYNPNYFIKSRLLTCDEEIANILIENGQKSRINIFSGLSYDFVVNNFDEHDFRMISYKNAPYVDAYSKFVDIMLIISRFRNDFDENIACNIFDVIFMNADCCGKTIIHENFDNVMNFIIENRQFYRDFAEQARNELRNIRDRVEDRHPDIVNENQTLINFFRLN